ncbi:MAG: ATP-binding protein [Syntrophomonadaceae bacterium]|jgi:predicted AAA+ superfamily ATPase
MNKLRYSLAGLTVYRNLLNDPLLNALQQIINVFENSQLEKVNAFSNFLFVYFSTGKKLRDYLIELIVHDDNPFSRAAETKAYADIDPCLIQAARSDLDKLAVIINLNFAVLAQKLGLQSSNWYYELAKVEPVTDKSGSFWPVSVEEMARYYARNSRGTVSKYKALRWASGRLLTGIKHPDPVKLKDLIGYERQKEQLCLNTEKFLATGIANNVLLYGSRGTGKSSMIKALLNEYENRNLCLVEIGREHLKDLPFLVSHLREYPAKKFIIFIDDLSFEDYETEYKGLKAVMEGSLEGQVPNVLIYATSNRRHLVREYFSDRNAVDAEVNVRDTMEEKLSLADRFGLTISFAPPMLKDYLNIVENLAAKRGLHINQEKLRSQALEWERSHHGPSGRTARQFIDSLR